MVDMTATRGFAILRGDVTEAAATAAEAERLGYHATWSPEFYTRSAVVSLAAMAQVTSRALIGSTRMIEVAGRVADGFLGHPLFGPRYYDDVVRTAIARGAARADRKVERVQIAGLVICVVSDDEAQARREAAAQIAFYAAPRTYGTVVEVSGFAEAGAKIREAFAAHDFAAMAAAVPDAMVDAMSASGTPAQVAARLEEFGRHMDHVIVYPASFGMTEERSRQVTADLLKAAAPTSSWT